MRRPGLRLTVGSAMIAVVVVALALPPLIAHRERVRESAWADYRAYLAALENAKLALKIAQFEQTRCGPDLKIIENEIHVALSARKTSERGLEPADWMREGELHILTDHDLERLIMERSELKWGISATRSAVARAKANEAALEAECESWRAHLRSSWLFR